MDTMTDTVGDLITGMLLAACWLRYATAPQFGDKFASTASLAAYEVSPAGACWLDPE